MRRSPAVSRRQLLAGVAVGVGGAILAACGDAAPPAASTAGRSTAVSITAVSGPGNNAPIATPASTATVAVAPAAAPAATSAGGVTLGNGMILGQTWEQINAKARGTTVNWYLFGASTPTNTYLEMYVIPEMQKQFGVTVKRNPVTDTVEAVNKVLAEKTAGKTTGGSVDMIWINGENFRTMAEANIVLTNWSRALPNAKFIAWELPVVNTDFGTPVNDREAPWTRGQFVFVHDAARTPVPWKSMKALEEYVKANPGTFTYPAPPDFTGSAFLRHVLYETTGGPVQYGSAFNEAVFKEKSPAAWEYVNRIKPFLWQKGTTYPESLKKLDELYANSEVNFSMSYSPTAASVGIASGAFPKSTRTFILDGGTVANVSHVTIPFNAANKEGALVLANFLQSPASQVERAKITRSGDATVLDLARLSEADRAALKAIPLDEATIPNADLAARALPELPAAYVDRIEKEWTANVLKK